MSDAPEEPMRRESRLPEYDEATASLLMECFQGLAEAQDAVLGRFSQAQRADANPSVGAPVGVAHGAYRTLDIEMRFILPTSAVLHTDVDEWAASVQNSVDEALPALMKKIFGRMNEILEEAGQVVDANGQPLSVAWVLQALEKVQIDFDEDGNAKMPILIVHPDARKRLAETPPTPEEEKQLEALIERKRQEFNARRRVRKLD